MKIVLLVAASLLLAGAVLAPVASASPCNPPGLIDRVQDCVNGAIDTVQEELCEVDVCIG